MAQYTQSDFQQGPQYGELKDREITDWSPDVSQVNIGQMLQNPPLAPFCLGGRPEMRAYDPSVRERLAGWLIGDNPSVGRRGLISGLLGSSGLGIGFGLLDLTPAGIPFAVNEAIRARDPQAAVLAIVPGSAAGRAAMAAERSAVRGARELYNIENASRYTSMYNPPVKPLRPFEMDYPKGAPGEPGSRLTVDIDGKPLTAKYVVGRRVVGGADETLSPAELNAVTQATIGSLPEAVAQGALPKDAIGVYRTVPGPEGLRREIGVLKTLPEDTAKMAVDHEVGHMIDDLTGKYQRLDKGIAVSGIPQDGIKKELYQVYHDLNDPSSRRGQITPRRLQTRPEDFGYSGNDIEPEYMAEAIRAYLADPNYMKTMAPGTAARVREYVRNSPRLSKILQFNTLAPFLGAAGGAGMMAASDGSDPRSPDQI
ncbi:hypothetical protein [Bradyrhizobium prioriisuperbiae]|uniref:hypothetical protein n=1 Tax=Bradyrhizobium prioriisuperbiae TaxID=2854389 RepID=UPI0028F16761|nr:hypothetical protein [Bradyrhizobium prioritasuperba]